MIPAWRLMLAPDSKEVKIENDEEKIMPDWVEAVPLKKHMDLYHKDVSARFFLMAPKMAETPSAYFAVKPPDAPKDKPNMEFVDLVIQSIAGFTVGNGKEGMERASLLAPLAAVVEQDDTVMGFAIRVLVNCVDPKKGDLLTKPSVEKAKKPKDELKPVTTQQVLKKMKKRR